MMLAIVVPVYNEERLAAPAVERLLATPPPRREGGEMERRVFLIDDGSSDGTPAVLQALAARPGVTLLTHRVNQGKGAALRTGIEAALAAGAEIVLIHDADLEYDPADHAALLAPILDGRADVVIGSRFLGQTHRVLYYWHSVANKVITLFSNMLTNLNLTDIECCLKAFSRAALERLVIEENRFGVEPELVAKAAHLRLDGKRARIYEVPVSYAGRTYAEGKKITWRDGLWALWAIARHNVL